MSAGGSNRLLTPDETAEYLAVTKRVLMDSYKRWGIPYVTVGKHVRFRARTVEKWIDDHTSHM